MLPAYFAGMNFAGHFDGAVNATSTINEKARDEVRNTEDMRLLKTRLQTMGHTEPPSRLGAPTQDLTGREGVNNVLESPARDRAPSGPVAYPAVEQLKRGLGLGGGSPQISSTRNDLGMPLPGSTRTSRILEDE